MSYLVFALVMLLGQFSPGPDMLLLTKNALNHPLRAALFTGAGISTGILVHTIVALTGLVVLLQTAPQLSTAIRYAGATYLTYLGIRLLLALRRNGSPTADSQPPAGQRVLSDSAAFRQGLLTNLLNPKAVAFFTGVLSQFLHPNATAIERLAYGSIIFFEAAFFWTLYVYLLQQHVVKARFLRAESTINLVFGLLLLALAVAQFLPSA
ncbi:MAG: LysE family translocator [Verrucomicrobiota bacterium]